MGAHIKNGHQKLVKTRGKKVAKNISSPVIWEGKNKCATQDSYLAKIA